MITMNKPINRTLFKKYNYLIYIFYVFLGLFIIKCLINISKLNNLHYFNKVNATKINLKQTHLYLNNNFLKRKTYKNSSLTVFQVDKILKKLSTNYIDHDFIHPLAKNFHNRKPFGQKMKTIKEVTQAINVLIEPKTPCKQNKGQNLSLVVLMPVAIHNAKTRNLIRQTYGSILKNNQKTDLYFLVGKSDNSK